LLSELTKGREYGDLLEDGETASKEVETNDHADHEDADMSFSETNSVDQLGKAHTQPQVRI
jgi:hypothetical protein